MDKTSDTVPINDDVAGLAASLHPLERKALLLFKEGSALSESQLLAADATLQPAQLSMALGWLQTKEILTVCDEKREEWVSLTERGASYTTTKHPALHMLEELHQQPLSLQEWGQKLDPEDRRSTLGVLKDRRLITIQSGSVLRSDSAIPEEFMKLQEMIQCLASEPCPRALASFPEADQNLICAYHHKRSPSKGIFRVDERIVRSFAPTSRFRFVYEAMCHAETIEEIGVLTPQILKEESWRDKSFRKYNLDLPPPRISAGRRHPYAVFLNQVRNKMVAMGFAEMQGSLVESEFWNMDALYMPQFHPARAIHDVYFIKGPMHDHTVPNALINHVAETHEKGSMEGRTFSKGWGYRFDRERTRRLILRSQGTAVSARQLAKGASGKYFSIARCFRYDAVDATHAPDFFQIEGIVVGQEVHFRTLLGLLTLFAKEIARAENIRFLPAYFPFTEPSVEMHVAHPQLGWMELGGAGLFRPEVTEPLGVDQPVIAWGLGLDRLAMMALRISDIRDLFATDLGRIRATPFLREDFTIQKPSS